MEYTPIHSLRENLNGNRFFVKREDLLPFSFGGNKARKAQLFFNEIKKNNNDCVVTYGSSSSNHCRVIANMAASKGLPCYIISPSEEKALTTNFSLINIFGARVIFSPISCIAKSIDEKLKELRLHGKRPLFIKGGGHGILGTQAYVECYNEIIRQIKIIGTDFDYIFLPSGTGSTQAGLVCGDIISGKDKVIVGISVARKNPRGEDVVVASIKEYMEMVKKTFAVGGRVLFIDDYVLDGYGSYNREILKVISRVLLLDGIALDTTYTGKAFWGMKEYIKKENIKNKNILFIHTGGIPLFFESLEELANGRKKV